MTLLAGFPAGHEDRSGLELAATLARSSGQDLALVLRAFPLSILAALLLVAGITHVRLLADLRGVFAWSVALAVGLAGATGHLLAAVIVGLVAVGVRSLLANRRPRA